MPSMIRACFTELLKWNGYFLNVDLTEFKMASDVFSSPESLLNKILECILQ